MVRPVGSATIAIATFICGVSLSQNFCLLIARRSLTNCYIPGNTRRASSKPSFRPELPQGRRVERSLGRSWCIRRKDELHTCGAMLRRTFPGIETPNSWEPICTLQGARAEGVGNCAGEGSDNQMSYLDTWEYLLCFFSNAGSLILTCAIPNPNHLPYKTLMRNTSMIMSNLKMALPFHAFQPTSCHNTAIRTLTSKVV